MVLGILSATAVLAQVSRTIVEISQNTAGSTGCYHSAHNGELVSVTGYISATAYNGFFMQDGLTSELYSGIWVYTGSSSQLGTNAAFITARVAGERVTVVADVEEYYDLTELNLRTTTGASVMSVSTGHTLVPRATTTGAIGTSCTANGEAHEGLLVTVTGVTITSEPNRFGEVMVDDGSGATQLEDGILNTDTHLMSVLGTTLTGQTLASVTGVVKYAYSSFEVHPRDEGDIVVGSTSSPPPSTAILPPPSPPPLAAVPQPSSPAASPPPSSSSPSSSAPHALPSANLTTSAAQSADPGNSGGLDGVLIGVCVGLAVVGILTLCIGFVLIRKVLAKKTSTVVKAVSVSATSATDGPGAELEMKDATGSDSKI